MKTESKDFILSSRLFLGRLLKSLLVLLQRNFKDLGLSEIHWI